MRVGVGNLQPSTNFSDDDPNDRPLGLQYLSTVGVGCVRVSGYFRMATRYFVWRPDLRILAWEWFEIIK